MATQNTRIHIQIFFYITNDGKKINKSQLLCLAYIYIFYHVEKNRKIPYQNSKQVSAVVHRAGTSLVDLRSQMKI